MTRSYLCKRPIIAAVIAIMLITVCAAVSLGISGKARAQAVEPCVAACETERIVYDGKIEHIFTHELVFDTAKAFAPTNSLRDCFDKDHLTASEFKALLEQLYNNDYVLIGLNTFLSGEPIRVPRGKTPFVLSFDDMTYDTVNRGCIDKLVLGADGKIYDYAKNARPQLSRERENITILESFIEAHSDFSPDGARATLCVNGYNGIFGYRCTPSCKVSDKVIAAETAECKKLVSALSDLGYTFASHTYYHSYFNNSSATKLEKDCAAWQKYIEPIVGGTRVLCFPAGEHKAKNAKMEIFKRYGFDVFLCVGNFAGTDFERASTDVKYLYRLPFDGTALRLYEKSYAHLVDTRAIYDGTRFRPFEFSGGYYK